MTEPTVGAMEKFLRANSDVPWEADDELMDIAREQDALVRDLAAALWEYMFADQVAGRWNPRNDIARAVLARVEGR